MTRSFGFRRGAVAVAVGALIVGGATAATLGQASAAGLSSGIFTIANACSGRMLDVSAFSQDNQAPVWVWDATGGSNQQWQAVANGATFSLRPVHAPTKALDVPGAQNVEGRTLWQYQSNGTSAQQWTSQDVGNGQVRLISNIGGKALQVRNSGASNASLVEIATPTATCAQVWRLMPVGAITPDPILTPIPTVPPTTVPPTTTGQSEPTVGRIWYVAAGGADTNSGTADQPLATPQEAVNRAVEGQKVVVKAGTYNLSSALTIIGKRRISIEGEPGSILNDGSRPRDTYGHGTVRIENSVSVRITGLRLQNSPFFGFRTQGSSDIELANNSTSQTKGSAIFFKESFGIRIVGNDVSGFCDSGSQVPNNFGKTDGCQEGISVSSTDGFVVANNTVHDAPMLGKTNPLQQAGGGEGIDIKQASKNGSVRNNSVFNLVQAGIYVDAYEFPVTNVEVSGNRVHDNASGIILSSEKGAALTDVRVFDNVSYRNGLVGIGIAKIMDDGPRVNIQIYNNTVYANGIGESKPAWANGPGSSYGFGISNESSNSSNVVIRDNIAFANSVDIKLANPAAIAATTLFGNFTDDPQFVNAPGGDFTLRLGSPAAGKGALR
jgi:Ricin-type beta-trefoil lectin domain-like/Right handed beta helix region